MPDLFDLFYRWRKQIISLVIATTVIAIIIVFCIPKKYLGVSTALPAPSFATDKTGVFSQNLQAVYSAFGSPDDLDKILGTARLDTVYIAVAEKLDLAKHYNIGNDESDPVRKAAVYLKKKTKVIRTDYGELQVKVWDKNKIFAASMSNAIMGKLQGIHQDVQTANNEMMLAKINDEYSEEKLEYQKLLDSLQHTTSEAVKDLLSIQKTSLLQQMQEYEQLSKKYKLMVDARPQALIIIENATPPLKADKPDPLQVIICAAILGFFFALVTALVLEKRRLIRK